MYRCNVCGARGEKPGRLHEEDCVSSDICRSCGSEDISISTVSCAMCGEPLYEGDDAYEVKDMTVCPECVREIMV
ncbi:MAG: hypothetical protein K5876_00450 [Ruminiclostridium sp.]|nr:hypothetical protein [Ruminiclostridium sp.]